MHEELGTRARRLGHEDKGCHAHEDFSALGPFGFTKGFFLNHPGEVGQWRKRSVGGYRRGGEKDCAAHLPEASVGTAPPKKVGQVGQL